MPHPFLHKIYVAANGVLEFERESLQKKARACVPEGELWIAAENRLHNIQLEKVGVIEAEEKGLPDLFLIELLQWFKHSFFSWVDKPPCQFCSGPTSFVGLSADPSHLAEASRTELFSCSRGHITPFHRYTNHSKLLETRKGRCGEWAACFTLICRSLGMDVRQVFDETDHVWTEVWSTTQCRWLHCDSCESICDAPLTYQAGWGKQLTYCIAYSRDDVQDVTWRYTQEPTEVVLARRTQCSESELLVRENSQC
jgi:peptide-N4-(N-acetyl-beta-glucosaminyl)asparagine amidase